MYRIKFIVVLAGLVSSCSLVSTKSEEDKAQLTSRIFTCSCRGDLLIDDDSAIIMDDDEVIRMDGDSVLSIQKMCSSLKKLENQYVYNCKRK